MVFGVGTTITPQWLAGVEVNGMGRGAGSWTSRGSLLIMLLGVLQYYPRSEGGLHLNVGAGPISVALGGEGGGADNYGFAARAGAGYDIRFRRVRKLAITPYASYAVTRLQDGVASTSGNGSIIDEVSNRSITQAGIAFRWYWQLSVAEVAR